MKWSVSSHKLFRKCQRQWYFKQLFASAIAKDPMRKEAHRLSKLCSIYAWRGKIVDDAISTVLIPALNRRQSITLAPVLSYARRRFDREKVAAKNHPSEVVEGFAGFLEVEHGRPLLDDSFASVWKEIDTSLRGLFHNDQLKPIMKEATYLRAQCSLSMQYDDVTVSATPDLIAFYSTKPPMIIDWKVQFDPQHDHWTQLGVYAFVFAHMKPHRDWPSHAHRAVKSTRLIEAQLLSGLVRTHTITDADEQDIEATISSSAFDMTCAVGGKKSKELCATDFLQTANPSHCERCPYKKMCWETAK